ncbi:MAG TPA: hypothetical protein VMR25_17990 [Planctomycetaceae bacterium]|jgi:hypothetical protein|nr:hypothetical protein [Planctomycetaceae bacterium]
MARALRDRLELNGHIHVAGRPAWRQIPPGPVRDGLFIAAIFWQPLSGGMMIGGEVGRMTSRFGESRDPKYGGLMAFP